MVEVGDLAMFEDGDLDHVDAVSMVGGGEAATGEVLEGDSDK